MPLLTTWASYSAWPTRPDVATVDDERGKESVFATEPMEDEAAEVERTRIEGEHASAGDKNRWIRVGDTSVQSKHIVVIRVQEPPTGSVIAHIDDDEPFCRRDMQF